ncbi:MAG TPA: hypothetical protein VEN29_16320 [Casimicrobiaceae bacterium]|nr:hypothetical protein [Casimicrobiaceae bacterium]
MKKSILFAAGLTVVLGGCASIRFGDSGFQPLVFSRYEPRTPNIAVVETTQPAQLVVDQDPIVIAKESNNPQTNAPPDVVITFALPLTAKYFFDPTPNKGILFIDPQSTCEKPTPIDSVKCVPQGTDQNHPKTFQCTYPRPAPSTRYHYCVVVYPEGSAQKLQLDPNVWND